MNGLKYLIELKDKLSNPISKMTDRVSKFMPKIDKMKAKLAGTNRVAKDTSGYDKLSGKLSSLTGIFKLATIGYFARRIALASVAVVGLAANIQNSERIINFATAGQGAENIAFLDKTIRDLNLPLASTYSSFQQVAGAFKDTALQGQPMRDIFEGVSTATAALNLSGEQTKGTFVALSQIMSKGRLSAEELVQQLGERLPGSMTTAARAMGMGTQQLMKLMETGKLMAKDFLPKFAAELKKTFGEEALRAAQTPQAAFTALKNSIERVKIAAGKELLPVFAKLARAAAPIIEKLVPLISSAFDVLFSHINALYGIISPLIGAIAHIYDTIKAPLMAFVQAGYIFSKTVYGTLFELIAVLSESVNWGYVLGGVLMAITGIFSGLSKVIQSLKPILIILVRIGGFIINVLGHIAIPIIEGVVWAFEKVANVVSWLSDKITNFLAVLGLIKSAEIGVKVAYSQPKLIPDFAKQTNTGGSLFADLGAGNFDSSGGLGSDKAKAASDGVSKGGSRPTNINISIGSLIEGGFTVQTTNIKEGAERVRDILTEELLKVLNTGNQVAIG